MLQIEFVGERGGGVRGDIAMDDIKIVQDCSVDVDCNFEDNNFCSWSRDTSNNTYNWEIATGMGNHHIGTGPMFDHTAGNKSGKYHTYKITT